MPQNSCIADPKINISTKLPELNISRYLVASPALFYIFSASSLSEMIGGRAPSIYGSPPLNESLLRDFISDFVLKMDTSLIFIFMLASPETDKFSGSSKTISIFTPSEVCYVTRGVNENLPPAPPPPPALKSLSYLDSPKTPWKLSSFEVEATSKPKADPYIF